MKQFFSKPLKWLVGDQWNNPRHPDFWLIIILLAGMGIRLWYLSKSLDWFVSFFIADDCFYYLNTVVNIVQGHGSSFDMGLTHHNGFHPLFLIMLLVPAVLGIGKTGLIYWAMGILCLAMASSIIVTYRLGSRWGTKVMALCVPIFLSLNIYFVRISFSGFETSLALALVLGLLYALASNRPGWLVGILLGLTGLARIELLIMAIPTLIYLVKQRRWKDLGISALISFILVLPWFIWSFTRFHSLLPLSGVAKLTVFKSEQLWIGFEHFCQNMPYLFMGYGIKDILPPQIGFAIGVIILFLVIRDWKTTGWASIIILIMLLIYGSLTNPTRVPQFIRYCVPALVILGTIFFTRKMRPHVIVPIVLALAVGHWSFGFYSWSARTGTIASFVGVGQSQIPEILQQISTTDDVIGCFDSGSIGYFADQPVINLDGLVNAEVVTMLRGDEGGTWTRRYLNYFETKGISIIVGGTSFSWVNIFPDLEDWKVLHPPIKTTNGGEVVFLRVPASEKINGGQLQ